MADRSIKGFNGANFSGHNVNIQSDNNNSTVNIGEKIPSDIFAQLRKEIDTLVSDTIDKEQALEYTQNLEAAVNNNDIPQASKYITWLERILQGSSALATIMQTIQPLL